MDNKERRYLLDLTKQAQAQGINVSVTDVFAQGPIAIQAKQQEMQVAATPQQQQQGLRPAHQSGNTEQSMMMPNVPPNSNINTVGLKRPIDIQVQDQNGHLVKSYENVPPGVTNLPTGPNTTTVFENPST